MGMPMGMIKALGILPTPELINHWADSLQIKFFGTVLACTCVTSWSIAHEGIMGMPMGMVRAPGILWMPELSNHYVDSLQIKCIGTVLAYRHATLWPLAHGGIMSMSIGMIKVLGILQTLELNNHWVDSQVKFFGTALACRCAMS